MRMCQYCPGILATVSGGMQGLIQDFQKGGGGGGGGGGGRAMAARLQQGGRCGREETTDNPYLPPHH